MPSVTNARSTQAGFEPLETPFDISLPPPDFEVGISDTTDQEEEIPEVLAQEIALASALEGVDDTNQDHCERFSQELVREIPLHCLQAWYKGGHGPSAIGALAGRKTITYRQGNFTVSPDDDDIFWTLDKTHLDLLICVGRGLGLGPLLPLMDVLHTYEFQLDLQKPKRQFTAKYAKLGFNPTDAMLWIGRSSTNEDVWLAFAPKAFTEGGEYNDETSAHWRGSRSTILSNHHFRCVVMFLAQMLYNTGFLDITVDEDFPNTLDDVAYKAATNMQ